MSIVKKSQKRYEDSSPEFRAIHNHAKISPRKARLVMDMIRGMPVSEALNVLKFDRHRGGFLIDRVLKSAIANADQAISEGRIRDHDGIKIEPQPEVDVDDLYIHDARIDDGPRLKRWKPRARGSAYPYKKYYSHISIRLRPRGRPGPTPKRAGESQAKAPAPAKKK
jgi:large subunit ribosomal protein L22